MLKDSSTNHNMDKHQMAFCTLPLKENPVFRVLIKGLQFSTASGFILEDNLLTPNYAD